MSVLGKSQRWLHHSLLLTLLFIWGVRSVGLSSQEDSHRLEVRDEQNDGSNLYPTRFDNVTWDDTNWRIKTEKFDQAHYQSRMSLANGYFGINVASVGPFYEIDDFVSKLDEGNVSGWPLFDRRQSFATIAGFYNSIFSTSGTNFPWLNQYGNESVISGIPHWSNLYLEADGQFLNASVNASQISNFSSTLDIKSGLLQWNYVWSPSEQSKVQVEYAVFVHKLEVNKAAVQGRFKALTDLNITVIDALEGDGALRTEATGRGHTAGSGLIWSSVSPSNYSVASAYIYSVLVQTGKDSINTTEIVTAPWLGRNESSIAQSVSLELRSGETAEFTKYVGVASTDAFRNDANSTAQSAALRGSQAGWASLLESHAAEWAEVLPPDSVDSYRWPGSGKLPDNPTILELQITSITNPFNLLQNVVSENAVKTLNNNTNLDTHSISVCGLASDCYAGMIFWDAEVWMAPGLAISHPQSVKQISKYRQRLYNQAKENIATAYQSSQNATSKFTGGAAYPWTSSRFGNCTGTGPCFDYEYHLNGDIGLQFMHYYASTGDTEYFKENLFPIFDSVAYFFAELLDWNETAQAYSLSNATDPDEYANHVNNPGFTMPLIQSHLTEANALRARFGLPINETWSQRAGKILQPVAPEAQITLEYDTMNGTISVKQADIVLIPDLLNLKTGRELADLDYYAGKQSPNGPGMTFGVFSVVANEFSPSGCSSWTYDIYSSEPYIRAPWFQYSEQLVDGYVQNNGTHPAFPFLTGMGGANRVAVFGFLGLRMTLEALMVDPSLPPQLQYIKYRAMYWQGHAVQAESNATHTSITRLPNKLPVANTTFDSAPIEVVLGFRSDNPQHFQLQPNATIVIKNREIGYNRTVDGNIAQCRPATTEQGIVPGQYASAAVDGAISTKWQPKFRNETSWVTVELDESYVGVQVSKFTFDFAQSPPDSLVVEFSNGTADFSVRTGVFVVANVSQIAISAPFDIDKQAEIVVYSGNTTEVDLDLPVYASKFARLGIKGNQGYVNPGGLPEDDPSLLQGATVAEWTIISSSAGRKIPLGPVQVPLSEG